MPDNDGTNGKSGDGSGDDKQTDSAAAEVEKWKTLARKHEAQAKANADKARRLDELEQSSASDLDKLTKRVEEAERKAAAAEKDALRLRIATEHNVSAADAELFLTGSDEETLRKQAKALADKADTAKRNGTVVTGEGKQPNKSGDTEMREFARKVFANP